GVARDRGAVDPVADDHHVAGLAVEPWCVGSRCTTHSCAVLLTRRCVSTPRRLRSCARRAGCRSSSARPPTCVYMVAHVWLLRPQCPDGHGQRRRAGGAERGTMLPSTLVGCSTKGYLGLAETRSWAERVASGLAARGGGDGVYACVPHPLVTVLSEGLAGTGADVGVQDVSPHPKGPYTGEVSAELLAELGVRYVMVGHPERVRHVGETPELFGRKVRAAVGHGLVPILVVGEPERSAEPEPVLRAQLDAAFGGLPDDAEV